jgi:hypothetical protein
MTFLKVALHPGHNFAAVSLWKHGYHVPLLSCTDSRCLNSLSPQAKGLTMQGHSCKCHFRCAAYAGTGTNLHDSAPRSPFRLSWRRVRQRHCPRRCRIWSHDFHCTVRKSRKLLLPIFSDVQGFAYRIFSIIHKAVMEGQLRLNFRSNRHCEWLSNQFASFPWMHSRQGRIKHE